MSVRGILILVAISLALGVIGVYAITSGAVLAVTRVHGFFAVTAVVAGAVAIGDFAVLVAGVSLDPFVRRVLAMVGVTTALQAGGSLCYALISVSHTHEIMLSRLGLGLVVASFCAFQCTVIFVIWTAIKREILFGQGSG